MDDVWNGEHLQRIRTWLFDGGVAGSVLYVTLMERGLEPAVVAIGLVMAAAMLGRRRYPVTVACVVYTAAPLHLLFDDAMRLYDVAVLISMFAVVKYRPQLVWGILAGVGAALGVVIGSAVEARRTDNFGTIAWVVGALTVAVWFSAYGVRTRRLYVASLEERAATLERERDHLARLAVADERAAIARELHDVVAHSLSVMIVQADGAGYTLDPSASRARQALDTIAATGRDALEDMRRVVSVLRGATPGTDTSRRRVGLAELDRLVERAGLRVDLDTVGTPTGLSVAEELTAYRIVQESLTNTLRHAGPDAKVTLRLEYTSGLIAIEATDDGAGRPAAAAATTRGGHGLVGMRERVALHGGTVTAGPRFDGGWSVTATIPRAPRVMAGDHGARAAAQDPQPPAEHVGVVEPGSAAAVEPGSAAAVEPGGADGVEPGGADVVERGDLGAADPSRFGRVEPGSAGAGEPCGADVVGSSGGGGGEPGGGVVEGAVGPDDVDKAEPGSVGMGKAGGGGNGPGGLSVVEPGGGGLVGSGAAVGKAGGLGVVEPGGAGLVGSGTAVGKAGGLGVVEPGGGAGLVGGGAAVGKAGGLGVVEPSCLGKAGRSVGGGGAGVVRPGCVGGALPGGLGVGGSGGVGGALPGGLGVGGSGGGGVVGGGWSGVVEAGRR
ncbi:histidine kinase [Dactylosporangium siamense]|uniref:histidine kinase n=1 Tax=Dactylosporangium siamense TaxID=685454 RepID=A0A919PG62_9ACTN|nr:histidine kinase [Dactylosporangium siamense]GIG42767.1 hypothetical protein Dsi01nite_008080 [Dactylosporangium siamense]